MVGGWSETTSYEYEDIYIYDSVQRTACVKRERKPTDTIV